MSHSKSSFEGLPSIGLLLNSVPLWSHDSTCHCLLLDVTQVIMKLFVVSIMSEPFKWSSPTGQTLCQNILKETALEYQPHDWQVQDVCQCLNGINLFAITPTEGEKMSYFMMYTLIVLAVSKDSSLCLTAQFPKDPCLIVICPTILLQLEMVCAQKSQSQCEWLIFLNE